MTLLFSNELPFCFLCSFSLDAISKLHNSSGYDHFAYHVNLLEEFSPTEEPKLQNKKILRRASTVDTAKSARSVFGGDQSTEFRTTTPRKKVTRAKSTIL